MTPMRPDRPTRSPRNRILNSSSFPNRRTPSSVTTASSTSSVSSCGSSFDLLPRIGDADRLDRPLRARLAQVAIIVTGAVAEPMPRRVEREQRHEHEIRPPLTRFVVGFRNIEAADDERIAGFPRAKHQALAPRLRQAQRVPLIGQRRHQRKRIRLAAHGGVAGDDRALHENEIAEQAARDHERCFGTRRRGCAVALRKGRVTECFFAVRLAHQIKVDGTTNTVEGRSSRACLRRWAPCDQDHGPGQGQLPRGLIKAPGHLCF